MTLYKPQMLFCKATCKSEKGSATLCHAVQEQAALAGRVVASVRESLQKALAAKIKDSGKRL